MIISLLSLIFAIGMLCSCETASFHANARNVTQKENNITDVTVPIFDTKPDPDKNDIALDINKAKKRSYLLEVDGLLSTNDISLSFKRHTPYLSNCFQTYLDSRPEDVEQGEVWLNFHVTPQGKTKNSRISFSDIRNHKFQHCILHNIAQIKFPSKSSSTYVKRYLLEFYITSY